MRAAFVDVLRQADKAAGLRAARRSGADGQSKFFLDPEVFRAVPGSPFAYRVSDSLRRRFSELDQFESHGRLVRSGMQTSDDFRFVRGWHEVVVPNDRWETYSRGGETINYYADLPVVVDWNGDGAALKAFAETTSGTTHWSRHIKNVELYFRPGITWPLRASRFSPRPMPARTIFSVRGYSAFTPSHELLCTLAVMASTTVDALFKTCLGRDQHPEFVTGILKRLPWPSVEAGLAARLSVLARSGWSLRRSLDTAVEVSHAFVLPALLQVEGSAFGDRVAGWSARVAAVEGALAQVQAEIDELCFELYGISEDDRRAIVEGFGVTADGDDSGGEESGDGEGGDDEDAGVVELDPARLAAALVSWAVGVGTGRFDVRLATGERSWPQEPDPFDPLPACSPGMLAGEDGLPSLDPPAGYAVAASPVLVDDPGHGLDITARVRSVFEVVFGDAADVWWSDVGAALGVRGGEVGAWLRKGFFDHHLKMYSRSRRKAPVLWPIGTKSGSYLVWLYAHRVSGDSLFQVLHDVVVPKLSVEDRELTRLRQEAGPSPSASQRKAIDAQERFVEELRDLRDELDAVAPLWAPDLNDGIVIVLAPLWRLFAHHRPWSNELKKYWGKLAKGDYDWAHLAMHLWPERVIPKCAHDRSLAIAHGLEDVFWVQDPPNSDKWQTRREPTTPLETLIGQRTNPTITAALQRAAT